MSIYSQREISAYRDIKVNPNYIKNRYIKNWWKQDYDKLIEDQISKFQWLWYWRISDDILENTNTQIIDNWRKNDPL